MFPDWWALFFQPSLKSFDRYALIGCTLDTDWLYFARVRKAIREADWTYHLTCEIYVENTEFFLRSVYHLKFYFLGVQNNMKGNRTCLLKTNLQGSTCYTCNL